MNARKRFKQLLLLIRPQIGTKPTDEFRRDRNRIVFRDHSADYVRQGHNILEHVALATRLVYLIFLACSSGFPLLITGLP